jgi:hypothetical protein
MLSRPTASWRRHHSDARPRKHATPSLAVLGLALAPALASAQPTYKLDVKPELKPSAVLSVADNAVARTNLKDDPGFRLQYHFKKDGQDAGAVEARSALTVAPPKTDPGVYTVVLELFYPAYKGGVETKGEYKPVSNVLTFRVEPGAPLKISVVPNP